MIPNEQCFVELLIQIADEVLPADRRDLERKAFQLQGHIVDLLDRLDSVDEVLDLMGDLKGAVEFLPIHGQLDVAGQHSMEADGHGLFGSERHVLEGVPHEALLLKLFDEGGVHVEVDGGVVAREVDVVVAEDFLLDGNGVEEELEVGVAFEVFDVAHVEAPGYLP